MAKGRQRRRRVSSQEKPNAVHVRPEQPNQTQRMAPKPGERTLLFGLKLWLSSGLVLLVALAVRFFSSVNNEVDDELPPPPAEGVGPWDWHEIEPDLKPMTVDFLHNNDDQKNETFWAYVTPDISRCYRQLPGSLQVREPSFPGQYVKFFNLSPHRVRLYHAPGADKAGVHMAYIDPFDVTGLSPKPGQQFFLTLLNSNDPKQPVLAVWQVEKGKNLLVYDPFQGQDASENLTGKELKKYNIQKENLLFADAYRKMTGRDWLALYGYQNAPKYPLWRADFFGQTHVVQTEQSHFTTIPPANKIRPFTPDRSKVRA